MLSGYDSDSIDLAKMPFFFRHGMHGFFCVVHIVCFSLMGLDGKFVRILAVHRFPLTLCTG